VNDPPRTIKPAIFVDSSRKDLRAFPAAVRVEIGQTLFEAQLGEHPRSAKPLKGLSGVLEIRESFAATPTGLSTPSGLRAFCMSCMRFRRSPRAELPPQRHIDLVKQRLRDAEAIHKASKGNR